MKNKKIGILIICALIAIFFVGARLWEIPTAFAEKNTSKPVTDNLKDLFVDLSKRLVPSVVNIYTTQTVMNPYGAGPQTEMYRKFFENFFGEDFGGGGGNGGGGAAPMPRARKATSLGTGFIIDSAEGLILTNYHVIADADEIKVILTEEDSDQDGIEAKVVGGDAEADVALLKIKTKRKLQAAQLGDSEVLQVGEWVMAVGNPFGHGHTVTKGIISAKERIVPLSQFSNYLQTDTPINPGNSGGPLINMAGQVIGINTAINAAAQGIGFAIPINYVKKILPDLRTKGAVTRGFIGVNITEITPPLAKHLHIKSDVRGVIISEVFEGEPAHKAGIQSYDVVTEVGDKKINDGRQLIAAISSYEPGAKVNVKILRNGSEKTLTVEIGKRPSRESMLSKAPSKNAPMKMHAKIGMILEDLSAEARRELALPANVNGVVVAKTTPGSVADEAGISRGDVIVEVDQKPTGSVDAFFSVVKDERVYLLRFRRGDSYMITSLDLKTGKNKKSDE